MPQRIRLPDSTPHELRKLLVRVARVNAQASNLHKVYLNPDGVGGGLDPEGIDNNFVLRAKRGCRTILHDFLCNALDELADIRREMDRMNERDDGVAEVNTRPCHAAGQRKR